MLLATLITTQVDLTLDAIHCEKKIEWWINLPGLLITQVKDDLNDIYPPQKTFYLTNNFNHPGSTEMKDNVLLNMA